MTELLQTYLQDHHAGSVAGLALFERVADSHSRPEVRQAVARLAAEVGEDKTMLEELMANVGVSPSRLKDGGARVAEVAGQLKPNQRLTKRSPLSDLLEVEALTSAVLTKRLGWMTLLDLNDERLPQSALQKLKDRAESQGQELERLHSACASVLHQH